MKKGLRGPKRFSPTKPPLCALCSLEQKQEKSHRGAATPERSKQRAEEEQERNGFGTKQSKKGEREENALTNKKKYKKKINIEVKQLFYFYIYNIDRELHINT